MASGTLEEVLIIDGVHTAEERRGRVRQMQPRFVIFDGPTSGLDMSVQAMVLNLLLELRGRLGLTYLFISHDLSVVERFCDRVAIMYLGRIVELAPTGKIFATPRHPYARALLAGDPAPATRAEAQSVWPTGAFTSRLRLREPVPPCRAGLRLNRTGIGKHFGSSGRRPALAGVSLGRPRRWTAPGKASPCPERAQDMCQSNDGTLPAS